MCATLWVMDEVDEMDVMDRIPEWHRRLACGCALPDTGEMPVSPSLPVFLCPLTA